MKTTIANFTGKAHIEIIPSRAHSDGLVPDTVMLTQQAGSMRFQFDMTPEEAVKMACALMEAVGLLDVVPA